MTMRYQNQIDYLNFLGCPSDKSNVIDPNFYNSCTVLINGLKLSNSSIPSFIENLSNLKILSGAIEITDTQLRNLPFLENVEIIDSPTYEKMQGININIHNNPEMTRLGLKSLKVSVCEFNCRRVQIFRRLTFTLLQLSTLKTFIQTSV